MLAARLGGVVESRRVFSALSRQYPGRCPAYRASREPGPGDAHAPNGEAAAGRAPAGPRARGNRRVAPGRGDKSSFRHLALADVVSWATRASEQYAYME